MRRLLPSFTNVKCWLGWHEWMAAWIYVVYNRHKECRCYCKHCGKVK